MRRSHRFFCALSVGSRIRGQRNGIPRRPPILFQREWLFGADIVGVTAGTSTPDPLIKEIEEELLSMSPDQRPLVDKALSAIPAMAGALSK